MTRKNKISNYASSDAFDFAKDLACASKLCYNKSCVRLWWNGIHNGLKIRRHCALRVQAPPAAPAIIDSIEWMFKAENSRFSRAFRCLRELFFVQSMPELECASEPSGGQWIDMICIRQTYEQAALQPLLREKSLWSSFLLLCCSHSSAIIPARIVPRDTPSGKGRRRSSCPAFSRSRCACDCTADNR